MALSTAVAIASSPDTLLPRRRHRRNTRCPAGDRALFEGRRAGKRRCGGEPVSTKRAAAWKALESHAATVSRTHLRQLFAEDPKRGELMAVEAVGLYLDYSKNRITDETLRLLLQLAEESGLRDRIDAMFRGDKINVSENRGVLHVALRAPKDEV